MIFASLSSYWALLSLTNLEPMTHGCKVIAIGQSLLWPKRLDQIKTRLQDSGRLLLVNHTSEVDQWLTWSTTPAVIFVRTIAFGQSHFCNWPMTDLKHQTRPQDIPVGVQKTQGGSTTNRNNIDLQKCRNEDKSMSTKCRFKWRWSKGYNSRNILR